MDMALLLRFARVCKNIGRMEERLGEYEGTRSESGIKKALYTLRPEYDSLLRRLENGS